MYKIYIVEDDEIIARTIKKHLEGWDYEVRCTILNPETEEKIFLVSFFTIQKRKDRLYLYQKKQIKETKASISEK